MRTNLRLVPGHRGEVLSRCYSFRRVVHGHDPRNDHDQQTELHADRQATFHISRTFLVALRAWPHIQQQSCRNSGRGYIADAFLKENTVVGMPGCTAVCSICHHLVQYFSPASKRLPRRSRMLRQPWRVWGQSRVRPCLCCGLEHGDCIVPSRICRRFPLLRTGIEHGNARHTFHMCDRQVNAICQPLMPPPV